MADCQPEETTHFNRNIDIEMDLTYKPQQQCYCRCVQQQRKQWWYCSVIYGPTSQIQSIVNLLRHTSTIPPNAHSGEDFENFIQHNLSYTYVMESRLFKKGNMYQQCFTWVILVKKINFSLRPNIILQLLLLKECILFMA